MSQSHLVLISGPQVQQALSGREREILSMVREAYVLHHESQTVVPHSTFLRFPDSELNRIICLPAWIGGRFSVAGVKWIASFPSNRGMGIPRASAVMALNSVETGRPFCFMEGSVVSAKRTAASAALASSILSHASVPVRTVALVGCGPINKEIARFLFSVHEELGNVVAYDIITARAEALCAEVGTFCVRAKCGVAKTLSEAIEHADVVSFATNAIQPHVTVPHIFRANAVVLHVSLRDLTPGVISASVNVVDDVDHVCRANTSIHLTEQAVGHRKFILCTLGAILHGDHGAPEATGRPVVFNPFGLGCLDLAVGKLAYDLASANGTYERICDFFPEGTAGPD